MSPYALQKSICEQYLKFYWNFGVKSIALRYFNVFGEGQEIANGGDSLALSIFLKQFKNKEYFTIVGDGEQRRDFIYVGDVIEANLKAAKFLESAESFEILDIGTGINFSINEIVNMMSQTHPRINILPRIEPRENRANISRAIELLNWHPTMDIKTWLKLQLL